jgi:hypothetical protein
MGVGKLVAPGRRPTVEHPPLVMILDPKAKPGHDALDHVNLRDLFSASEEDGGDTMCPLTCGFGGRQRI